MTRTASTLAILAVSIGGMAGPARADDGSAAARGAVVYAANCGRCHNARAPRDLGDRDWVVVVTHMRVIAGLPGEQAREVLAFLQANNDPPLPAAAEAPAGGEEAHPTTLSGADLIDSYGCRACHVVDGRGGNAGPDLDTAFQRRSEDWIRVQIEHPREHNATTIMPPFGFTDPQADAIIEELRTHQKR
jgi:mono/diheme cytochrome c family protein